MKELSISYYAVDSGLTGCLKFKRLKRLTELPDIILRGLLTGIWQVACDQYPSGNINDPLEDILELLEWETNWGKPKNIANALLESGFIVKRKDVFTIKNWDDRQPLVKRRVIRRSTGDQKRPAVTSGDRQRQVASDGASKGKETKGNEIKKGKEGERTCERGYKDSEESLRYQNFFLQPSQIENLWKDISDDSLTMQDLEKVLDYYDQVLTEGKRKKPRDVFTYLRRILPDLIEEMGVNNIQERRVDPDDETGIRDYAGTQKPPPGSGWELVE